MSDPANETGAVIETWTPRQSDFDRFANISGDDNPIHVDPEFSARTRFGRTVSHGMLLYARLWAMIQRYRPGVAQAGQTLMFPNPSYADEPLVFRIASIADQPDTLSVSVTRQADGEVTLQGECILKGAEA